MRLHKVARGNLKAKLAFGMIRLLSGQRAPDVVRVLFYRPEFFGTPFRNAMQAVMRGDSDWTPAERELFAAFTSRLNQCLF